MKIKSENFINFIDNNTNNYKIILLYGPNGGLVNLLFNNALKALSIDIKDPFNVSKFFGQNILDDPSLILDTISTFSITSDKRIVLLDLCNASLKKEIIDNIIFSISNKIDKYLIIMKADNLGTQNELVKFTQNSNIGILVPCYDENSNQIKFDLSNIFKNNNFLFSNSFLLHLASKFSNDSSINKMELEKLDNFLINNNSVTESTLLNLITDNTYFNLNKISNFCAQGDVNNAMFFYEKALAESISSIAIIRNLVKHFKMIEKILCSIKDGNNIENAINIMKPPIFFKDKQLFFVQTKLWNLQKVNLVLKRLIDAEIKCKSGIFLDKLLAAQLILSTSVIAKNALKT